MSFSTSQYTPMYTQYLGLKAQASKAVLFYRLGDFYETFNTDAQTLNAVCNATLTSRSVSRNEKVPMAGVPIHALDVYVEQLRAAGYAVAIADQIGNDLVNGVVLREIVKTVKAQRVRKNKPLLIDTPAPVTMTATLLTTATEYATINPQDEAAQEAVDLLSEDTLAIEEARATRPNAKASVGQHTALTRLVNRHCVGHSRVWFYHFTNTVLGKHVAANNLTVREASQVEIALAAIARKRCRYGDYDQAHLDLDLTLKLDCFPQDWERAKAEYAEVVKDTALDVSAGRTSSPKYLTVAEAVVYSRKVFQVVETYRKYAETITVQA